MKNKLERDVRESWHSDSFDRLADLVLAIPSLGDLLDLVIGAAASVMRAEQLGYRDRQFPLPDDYYEHLAQRTRRMACGTLPSRGLWISGYYFNSGLLRLSEARKQTRSLLRKLAKHEGRRVVQLADDRNVLEEADRLKHEPRGLRARRQVTFEEAVRALRDVIAALQAEQSGLARLPVGSPRPSGRSQSTGESNRHTRKPHNRAATAPP